MKTRAHWFCMSPGAPRLRETVAWMRAHQYSRQRTAGFQIANVRRDYVEGTFLERVEWDDSLDDPARGTTSIHRVELRRTKFRIATGAPEVELLDPPRSARSFVEQLSLVSNTSVRFEPVTVDPKNWLTELKKLVGKCMVTDVTTDRFPVTTSISAAFDVGGSEDVWKHLPELAQGQTFSIKRIRLMLGAPHSGRVELLVGGRAVLTNNDDDTVGAVRAALRAAQPTSG